MLHGFMGSGKAFDHLIDELSDFCNPITIDLAGHGKTESPDEPKYYTAEWQVHQLKSISQRLKFENLYLYGYSMGGRLAFQMVASYSDLFSGAVIESAHCGIESEYERSKRIETDEKRALQIEKNFSGFIDGWMNLPLFQQTSDRFKNKYEEIMREQKPENMSASLRGFGAGVMPNVCGQIIKKNMYFTFITGEHDLKYVEVMSDIATRCKYSNLHIIKEAGHRVHTDQPMELIKILKNTVEGN